MAKSRLAKPLRGKHGMASWGIEFIPIGPEPAEWDSWHGASPEKLPSNILAVAILENALKAALRLAPAPGLHHDKRETYKKRYRDMDQQSALEWLNSASLDHLCECISLEADYVRRLLREALAKRKVYRRRASYTIHGASHK